MIEVGTRYGRLTVTGPPVMVPRPNGRNRAHFPVRCDCGTEKLILLSNVENGITASCGCAHREKASAANVTHGGARTRLYRIWKAMRDRCYRDTASNYRWYGGKGIRVNGLWDVDFAAFRTWALANGYAEHLTIDRIDPLRDYEPDNCEWVTGAENARRAQLLRLRDPKGRWRTGP